MQRIEARLPVILALLGGLALGGCGRGGGEQAAAADSTAIDTTNRDELDGLSTRQVEQQARPMTQEEAEKLGIVDTTIHVEKLTPDADTGTAGPPAAAPAPTDTTRPTGTP
ncbi:MAG TPA: hypothetical protein VHG28_15485 [Longimicrobiaceae bacterium]|nr:hypothetical protein [Longimicrobiaceae bacterium]